MPRVKICGITNLTDAMAAVDAGADALGFNFFRESPRYLAPESARSIIAEMPSEVLCVGVFVNETKESVESAVAVSGVSVAQLHGDETPEFCESLNGFSVIKAFRGRKHFDPRIIARYRVEAILFDAYEPDAWGGTGRMCDWEMARGVRAVAPKMYLAGGLTPETVAAAISAVEPFALDVCSGVERAPGKKDHALVRRFVAAAREAERKA